jgi:hypothetical protein
MRRDRKPGDDIQSRQQRVGDDYEINAGDESSPSHAIEPHRSGQAQCAQNSWKPTAA